MDKISVIVPVFNLELWVRRCVYSIMAQTYQNLEILLVDDGSRDSSLSILEALAAEDPRIKVIHKENGGLVSARLAGIAAATGDWLTFVDGDDEIDPEMYERLMRNAKDHDADISHCGYVMIFPDGKRVYHCNSGTLRLQDNLLGLQDLLEETLVEPSACNKIYKRSLFGDLRGKYLEEIWNNEDMLLNFYLFSKAERSVFEDFCPYLYWLRDGSLSRRKPTEHTIYDPIRVKEIILEQCKEELRDDAKKALTGTCLYIYAKLSLEPGEEYDVHRDNVRRKLLQQKEHIHLLSRRNALLLELVCRAPWLFRFIYRVYALVLKKK